MRENWMKMKLNENETIKIQREKERDKKKCVFKITYIVRLHTGI